MITLWDLQWVNCNLEGDFTSRLLSIWKMLLRISILFMSSDNSHSLPIAWFPYKVLGTVKHTFVNLLKCAEPISLTGIQKPNKLTLPSDPFSSIH